MKQPFTNELVTHMICIRLVIYLDHYNDVRRVASARGIRMSAIDKQSLFGTLYVDHYSAADYQCFDSEGDDAKTTFEKNFNGSIRKKIDRCLKRNPSLFRYLVEPYVTPAIAREAFIDDLDLCDDYANVEKFTKCINDVLR